MDENLPGKNPGFIYINSFMRFCAKYLKLYQGSRICFFVFCFEILFWVLFWEFVIFLKKKKKKKTRSLIRDFDCALSDFYVGFLMAGWFLTSLVLLFGKKKKMGFHNFWGSSWVSHDAFPPLTFNDMYETFLFFIFEKRKNEETNDLLKDMSELKTIQ